MVLFEWVQEHKTTYNEAQGINILYARIRSLMLKLVFWTLNARIIMGPVFYADTSNSERYMRAGTAGGLES